MDWLIFNESSGSGRTRARLDRAVQEFQKNSVSVEVKSASTIPEIEDIARRAATSHVTRLWVLAGDGTTAAVAGCLCYSETILCPLPGGTVNVYCRELGIPTDVSAAIPAILAGRKMEADVGKISVDGGADMKFLLMASVGLDAQTVRDVNLNLKEKIGPLAYVVEGILKLMSFDTSKLFVIDEHGIERVGYHLIVQNSRFYGGAIPMAPKAKMDDGRFDVILIKKPGRLALLNFLFSIPTGRHLRLSYVEYFRSTTIQVKSAETEAVQADGDCLAKLPAHLSVLPKALRVMAVTAPLGA